ncbi:MAG: hypothetical protein AAFQ36_02535 [Pseudomonadota bacterium]
MLLYLPLATAAFGTILGAWRATKRGGDIFDVFLWAFGHACAFGLPVFIALIVLDLVI